MTLLTVVWSWTPWHHETLCSQVEYELSLRTGMGVSVGHYSRLDPSRVRLDNVELSDPETNQLVMKARVAWWSDDGETIAIRLSQPELNMAKLAEIESLIQDRLLRQPHLVKRMMHLTAYDVTLHGNAEPSDVQVDAIPVSRTLRQIRGSVQPRPNHVDVTLDCFVADSHVTSEPLRLTLRRDRSTNSPGSIWEFDSGPNALPLRLLANHFPWLNRLGAKAKFQGTFRFGRHFAMPHAEVLPWLESWYIDAVAGQIENVDLATLSTGTSAWITGEGTLRVDRCCLEPRKKLDFAGSLVTRNGRVSRDLLEAVAAQLRYKVAPLDASESHYDLMAVAFQISDTRLRMRGICRTEPGYESVLAGVAVTSGWNPLAVAQDEDVPTLALLRVFDARRDLLFPATSIPWPLLLALPKQAPAAGKPIIPASPLPGVASEAAFASEGSHVDESNGVAPEARIGRLQKPAQGTPLMQPR
ncbi:MAG: hypothetical protein AAGD07_17330 [Planctomycetota bacterium]